MIDKAMLTELYRHMEWADAVVWTAVIADTEHQNDQKLRDLLFHLHIVQRAFLGMWQGVPLPATFPSFDSAPALMAWGRSVYAEGLGHLEGLTNEQINGRLELPPGWTSMVEQRLGRVPGPISLGETALQVTQHSTYHRGQVNARFRELGGEPPLVDYISWVWRERPAPAWPSESA